MSVCLSVHTWGGGGGGIPVPGSLPGCLVPGPFQGVPQSQVLSRGVPQSQVLSHVSGPRSFPGVPQTWPGLGVPPDRVGCGQYASCGFPREDFLVYQYIFRCAIKHSCLYLFTFTRTYFEGDLFLKLKFCFCRWFNEPRKDDPHKPPEIHKYVVCFFKSRVN